MRFRLSALQAAEKTGSVDFIAAAFQPIDIQSNYLYPENGKIKAAYVEPEYKERH